MKKRTFICVIGLLLSLWLISFVGYAQEPKTKEQLIAYLDSLGAKYEDICVEMGIANWNVYSGEGPADQDTPKRKYAQLLLEPQHKRVVDEWLKKIDKEQEPRLYRRLEVWHNVFAGAHVDMDSTVFKIENALEARITNFRYAVEDTTVHPRDLNTVLAKLYPNPQQRKKKLRTIRLQLQSAVQDSLLMLMRLRNERAQQLGYKDYGDMVLTLQELDPQWFYDIIAEVDKRSIDKYKALLENGKEKAGVDSLTYENLRQVIYANIEQFERPKGYDRSKALELAKETLKNIGFDFDQLPIRIVEKNIPYGGLGLAIKVPTDHRILVLPGRGRVGLYLHEIGHGLHAVFTKWGEPIFKNYEWCLGATSPCYDEGMANVSAGMAKADAWQIRYNNMTKELLDKQRENERKVWPFVVRNWVRRFLFEFELYKNLDRNPEEVYHELYKKWMLVELPEDQPSFWATSVMPVAYPCYGQNYFIADMITWQVHQFLKKKFSEDYPFNSRVSQWLTSNLYYMGHGMRWMERIEKATGKPLDVDGYLTYHGL